MRHESYRIEMWHVRRNRCGLRTATLELLCSDDPSIALKAAGSKARSVSLATHGRVGADYTKYDTADSDIPYHGTAVQLYRYTGLSQVEIDK